MYAFRRMVGWRIRGVWFLVLGGGKLTNMDMIVSEATRDDGEWNWHWLCTFFIDHLMINIKAFLSLWCGGRGCNRMARRGRWSKDNNTILGTHTLSTLKYRSKAHTSYSPLTWVKSQVYYISLYILTLKQCETSLFDTFTCFHWKLQR